jgi:hypothetical protein
VPSQFTVICSEHFEKCCFITDLKNRRLKPSAFPTIFKGFPKYLQSQNAVPQRNLKRKTSKIEVDSSVTESQNVQNQSLLPSETVLIDHNYCALSPKKLNQKLQEEKERNKSLNKKLKTCQRNNQRLKANVSNLQDVVTRLKQQRLLGENAFNVLQKCATEVPNELFKRLQTKLTERENLRETYPQTLRNFALTLHFHSPKAYR